MKQYLAGKIRNIVLTGHAGSGKTSLAEAMLFKAGELDRLGKIQEGNTALDNDPEEIKRKSTIGSSVYPFTWGSVKINLVDTPGLFDFANGLSEGMRAAESTLINVSARSGVSVGAKKAYKLALKQGRSRMIFVNKMDSERADFYKTLQELKTEFGPEICPLVVPYVIDGKAESYIDLVQNKAYRYNEKGIPSEVTMPDMAHRLEGLQTAISEAVAETDEDLFEKFFSGESFTRDELLAGIHKGVETGTITPVLCGSATSLEGIDMLLDALVDHLPSAWENGSELAVQGETQVRIECNDEAPLAAFVFKTVADPFVGKLSYIKVVAGRLSADSSPINSRTCEPEKVGKIIYTMGKKQEETAFLSAGDIGAVAKLASTKTGDSLCAPERIVSFEEVKYPNPTLSMAIKVHNKGDEGKVAQSILRLIEEDPSLQFEQNPETHQMIVSGSGEQHLDVLISRLKNKFGVEVDLVAPRIPYRETILSKVKVQGKHKKQSGGHGQFGDVWIEFEPYDGDELLFETNVFGGSVPKNFFPAVEKGLQDAVKEGIIAGYPMVGLKATLVDGSYHPVDSSEMAFKTAAAVAYKEGISKASPILLEPIGTVKVLVPDSFTGDIMGELTKRRGRVTGMNPEEDGMQEIEGEVPLSEMTDFTNTLRSISQGQGSFSLSFQRYEQLPPQLQEQVIQSSQISGTDDD